MKLKTIFTLLLIAVQTYVFAQNITARVTDSQTGEPLPNATVKINGTTELIANNDGYFNFNEKQSGESGSITVSFLGYTSKQLSIADLKNQNLTIKLTPGVYELENMTISNSKPDPYKIIAEVKKHLKENYKTDQNTSQRKLFFRESSAFKASKMNIEIDKSTGFSKKQLKEANTDLEKFTTKIINNPSQQFNDILCNYYNGKTVKDNKTNLLSKLEVIKATSIRGNESTASVDDMQDVGTSIILKHLDTTKFYRIKSGLFGSRDTVSLNKNYNKKKNKKKDNSKLANSRSSIQSFLLEQRLSSEKFEFINSPELYSYQLEKRLYDDTENEVVYIIKFSPKKRSAIYTGTLYVSETDYAVLKCNYTLAEDKKVNSFNLRLLLGVKASENVSSGTLIFKKDPEKKHYNLHYAFEETGMYFYVNRPLKFIELTNEDKDIVALDIKVEGNSIKKSELLNIAQNDISDETFNTYKEVDFEYIQLKRYDPSVWQNHISIEPLEAMKEYRAMD
ncbi:carboxypeptidase-like regulatory domain-containing protein [Flavobacterium pedocola]